MDLEARSKEKIYAELQLRWDLEDIIILFFLNKNI